MSEVPHALPLPKLSPLPWAIDLDEREGMEWNIHIVERDRPYMRVCFMSQCSQAESNAALIVRSVNALPGLVKALEEVRAAILEASPHVLTDTFWMPDRISKNTTVVDHIEIALAVAKERV